MIGQTIGPYRVTAKLGEGGMGQVYRATDARLRREVAIKVLPDALRADPARLARFEREAQTASNLNHPNILTIFEIGEADGIRFMAAELVACETLGARLARGTLSIDEAVDLARQIELGSRGGARGGHRAPGPQAGQRDDPARRAREGARLRSGKAHRTAPGRLVRRDARGADR
jgi:serine/threonine protein kinase